MTTPLSPCREAWKPIPSFPGYQASTRGRIRSVTRVVTRTDGATRLVQGLVLRQSVNRNGYPWVGLSLAGRRFCREVHGLVCEAFHGPRPTGHEAAHDDGNRMNPTPANVLWKTKADNIADRTRHGTENTGERNGRAKLTAVQAAVVCRRARRGENMAALGREFGIATSHVLRIRDGQKWRSATAPAQ